MPSTLEVLLFFLALSFVESFLRQRRVRGLRNLGAQTATIRIAIQRIEEAFKAL